MKRTIITIIAALALPAAVLAQEHPEHPKANAKHSYSIDELDKAITAEIVSAQDKNGGWYLLKDNTPDKTWKMKLDHVHRERLSKLDDTTYFACTDFKSDDGHTVDVDFFMKDNGKKLVMSDVTVHKVDGKPRYNWKEKDGYWTRVPVTD
jgi:hypothetical protein